MSIVLLTSCQKEILESGNEPIDRTVQFYSSSQSSLVSHLSSLSSTTLNYVNFNSVQDYNRAVINESNSFAGESFPTTSAILNIDNSDGFNINWQKALNTGYWNASDELVLKNFANDCVSNGYSTAIQSLEQQILSSNYSSAKKAMYAAFINSMNGVYQQDPLLLTGIDCTLSIIGFACSAIGLCALEVGTGGLATGAVIVGFCAASASLGNSC